MQEQTFIETPAPIRLATYLSKNGALGLYGVNLFGDNFTANMSPEIEIAVTCANGQDIQVKVSAWGIEKNRPARVEIGKFHAKSKEQCLSTLRNMVPPWKIN